MDHHRPSSFSSCRDSRGGGEGGAGLANVGAQVGEVGRVRRGRHAPCGFMETHHNFSLTFYFFISLKTLLYRTKSTVCCSSSARTIERSMS